MNLAFVDNYDFPPRFQESQKSILEKKKFRRQRFRKIRKQENNQGNPGSSRFWES